MNIVRKIVVIVMVALFAGVSLPAFANGQYSHNEKHSANTLSSFSQAQLQLKHTQQQLNHVVSLQKELKGEKQKLDDLPVWQSYSKVQEKLREAYQNIKAAQDKLNRLHMKLQLQYKKQFIQVQIFTIRSVAKSTAHISAGIH